MYSKAEPSPKMNGDQYVKHVESLRSRFSLRIEVRIRDVDFFVVSRAEKALLDYLDSVLTSDMWRMQEPTGFRGLYYFWFMEKEDALAFSLKFGGKVA